VGTAHPVRAAVVEGLKTFRSPGQTPSNPGVVGCLAHWQQHVHHLSGLAEREPGAEFGLNANKLRGCSRSDQRRHQVLVIELSVIWSVGAITCAGSPARLLQRNPAEQRVDLPSAIVVQWAFGPTAAAHSIESAQASDLILG
jgi:hypothetical protein